MSPPTGPFKLVTVNTAPERAKRLIGRVVSTPTMAESYTIIHAANCDRIEDVEATMKEIQPDLLFCASMWSPEESEQVQSIAKKNAPGIKTLALPKGLQVERGPDAVVDWIVEKLPGFIGSEA